MENDKVFDLLTKLYSEMQNGFKEVNKRLDRVEERLNKVENNQMTMENELKEMKKTLFDGYVQNTEAIKRLEAKVDELSEKVDRHDIKIQVIEGGKSSRRKAK
ncbi:MAG: hypothetical protein N2486_09760 [Caloramator sp.]|nr:hypothetical protein [Caloramator sp.]